MFNIRSFWLYESDTVNLEPQYYKEQALLDTFFKIWAQKKLNIGVDIAGIPLQYNDHLDPDPEYLYGLGLLYRALYDYYKDYDLWLVYGPYYTPRPKQEWSGFYDMQKMVYSTYIYNWTQVDEAYIISEELLHALLHKTGKPKSVWADLVHQNRSKGIADFWDKDGNLLHQGIVRDDIEGTAFITVGGTY